MSEIKSLSKTSIIRALLRGIYAEIRPGARADTQATTPPIRVIQQNRHPEKNTAIMQISFKLGLRAQEITLLQIKEVASL